LVSNAIKFSEKGSRLAIRIEVDSLKLVDSFEAQDLAELQEFRTLLAEANEKAEDQHFARYTISVQDYGVGITAT
jgi:signal transduction histidine kinase